MKLNEMFDDEFDDTDAQAYLNRLKALERQKDRIIDEIEAIVTKWHLQLAWEREATRMSGGWKNFTAYPTVGPSPDEDRYLVIGFDRTNPGLIAVLNPTFKKLAKQLYDVESKLRGF